MTRRVPCLISDYRSYRPSPHAALLCVRRCRSGYYLFFSPDLIRPGLLSASTLIPNKVFSACFPNDKYFNDFHQIDMCFGCQRACVSLVVKRLWIQSLMVVVVVVTINAHRIVKLFSKIESMLWPQSSGIKYKN